MTLYADRLIALSSLCSHLVSAQKTDLNTNVGLLDLVQLIYEVAPSPLAPVPHSLAAHRVLCQYYPSNKLQQSGDGGHLRTLLLAVCLIIAGLLLVAFAALAVFWRTSLDSCC